jgi:hypothetical protein
VAPAVLPVVVEAPAAELHAGEQVLAPLPGLPVVKDLTANPEGLLGGGN